MNLIVIHRVLHHKNPGQKILTCGKKWRPLMSFHMNGFLNFLALYLSVISSFVIEDFFYSKLINFREKYT